jgi:wyosine [tRNA(Phe)-imidazoG37] synthetase (radical SAM superfamily)
LALAAKVALKLDGVTEKQIHRINRPHVGIDLAAIREGITAFAREYDGELAIQTMVLTAWEEKEQEEYIKLLEQIQPQQVQLNTPKRPKPQQRQLEGRGNHSREAARPYAVNLFRCVEESVLKDLAARISQKTQISVRYS